MIGEALSPGATAGAVLLSRSELERLTGGAIIEPCDAIAAVARMLGDGVATVLVSLSAGSAVLVEDAGAYHAECTFPVPAADDAAETLLENFRAAGGRGPDALHQGLARSAARARERAASGADRCGPEDVVLTWIDALELIRER